MIRNRRNSGGGRRITRRFPFLLLGVLLLLPAAVHGAPLTFIDHGGREFALPSPPRRVVSLVPAVTEILFAIGAGDRLVGTTCNRTPVAAAGGMPVVGGFLAPSPAAVRRLEPEVVFYSRLQNGITAERNVFERLAERRIYLHGLVSDRGCNCAGTPAVLAIEMERALLEPWAAAFLTAAMAVSDAHEAGRRTDLDDFRQRCLEMAARIAGRPMERLEQRVDAPDLPPVMRLALDALANGVRHRAGP